MRRHTLPVLVAAAVIALLAGCMTATDVGSEGVPADVTNPKKAMDSAVTASCRANLRAIHAMVQAFQAENGRLPNASDLAAGPDRMPKEPAGGSYTIDPATGAVTCSVGHGRYPE